jgi:hypothetical protein
VSFRRPRGGLIRASERGSRGRETGPMIFPVVIQGLTVRGAGEFAEPSGPLAQVLWHDVSSFPCFP